MGIETEYGITAPGRPDTNPMLLSSQVVNAFANRPGGRVGRARWDYEDEAPLRDARGGEQSRGSADPSQLTDVPAAAGGAMPDLEDPSTANVVLTNGARLYVDHAHPEYSSPEVTGPRAAVVWDKAGELVMREAAERVAAQPGPRRGAAVQEQHRLQGRQLRHPRELPAEPGHPVRRRRRRAHPVLRHPPGVHRGRAGRPSARTGRRPGSSCRSGRTSSRSRSGLETTLKRPIVNTRDEPHASADRYRRLHVILGDANLLETATYLKVGTTALVLDMIEARTLPGGLALAHPVAGAARRQPRPDPHHAGPHAATGAR